MTVSDSFRWSQHVTELSAQRLALDAVRAMQSADPADLEAVLARLQVLESAAGVDAAVFEEFESALAQYAVLFGRRAHGDQLDAVLAGMQMELDEHLTTARRAAAQSPARSP